MSRLSNHLLSAEKAKALVEEYKRGNYQTINNTRGENMPDTLNCCYDLEVLEEYLAYVRRTAEDTGKTDVKIRVNFGQYPTGNFDSRLNADYKGHQTVFLSVITNKNVSGAFSVSCDDDEDFDNLDYGQLCPPSK